MSGFSGITLGIVVLLQPSATDEQMECEGHYYTLEGVYAWPVVSPDAYSGADWIAVHCEGVDMVNA